MSSKAKRDEKKKTKERNIRLEVQKAEYMARVSQGEEPGTTPEISESEGDDDGGGVDGVLCDEDFDLLLISPTRAIGEESSLPLPPPGSLPARTSRLSLSPSPSFVGSGAPAGGASSGSGSRLAPGGPTVGSRASLCPGRAPRPDWHCPGRS